MPDLEEAAAVAAARTTAGAPSLDLARRNRLLNELSDADLTELLREATAPTLDLGTVLYEPGRPVTAVHFPLTGVISLVTDLGDLVVEAATVGNEGMSGISVFLGAQAPTERANVQVGGRAIAIGADAFDRGAASVDGPLYAIMRRYTQILFTQLARNTACNRVHTVEQRAARWLLATADRMDTPTFGLTQHFLAQMLAVRRASVSRIASTFAAQGCIRYTRGTLTILDRAQLRTHACSCYQAVRDATDRALAAGSTPAS
ncbi:cAMP-binding domain of CRP or a regulatory subunit of cAMP-dependent protein kinases [Friedmanniella luteola]|uniref:cAMP-binding domain of CRP or a regulatory subunit of cAMP-dependent protein kinases n=1 Tax=Friedmanniella luteola TaxID=546871 RepID=A0A1H1XP57_9ACTN|nr:Crp/Fnr family transcriptional regulator [Friedmanniella luteola]SDT10841.1 cAMP-binding domain of CRP or a regulatory subunit of cAMP-dependent protein kinases [Friedmanniella luteola]